MHLQVPSINYLWERFTHKAVYMWIKQKSMWASVQQLRKKTRANLWKLPCLLPGTLGKEWEFLTMTPKTTGKNPTTSIMELTLTTRTKKTPSPSPRHAEHRKLHHFLLNVLNGRLYRSTVFLLIEIIQRSSESHDRINNQPLELIYQSPNI